jgi:hypothetical protein
MGDPFYTYRIRQILCAVLGFCFIAVGCDDNETAAAVEKAKSIVAEAPPPPGTHVLVVIDKSGSQPGARTTEASVFIERLPAGSRVLVLECGQTCRPIGPSEFLTKSRWRGLAGEQFQNIEASGPSYPFEWIRVLVHLTRLAEPHSRRLPAVAVVFTDGVATVGEARPEAFTRAAEPLLEDAALGLVIADGDGSDDDVFAELAQSDRVARISTRQTEGPGPLVAAVARIGKVIGGERPEAVITLAPESDEGGGANASGKRSAAERQAFEENSKQVNKSELNAGLGSGGASVTESVSPTSQSGRGIGMMQVRQRAEKNVTLLEPDDPKSPFSGEADPFESLPNEADPDSDGMSPVERIRKLVINRQYDEAKSQLRARLEEHPDDTEAWLYLARLGAFTGAVEHGIAVLEEMVETMPNDEFASIALATAYADEASWPLRCAHLQRVNTARSAECRPASSEDCPLASHLTIWGVEAKAAGLPAESDPIEQQGGRDSLAEETVAGDFRARLSSDSERRALPILMDDRGFIHLWRSPNRFEMRWDESGVRLDANHLPERTYRLRVVPVDADASTEVAGATLELRLPGMSESYEFELASSPVDVVDFTFEMPDYDDVGGDIAPDALRDWRVQTCAASP